MTSGSIRWRPMEMLRESIGNKILALAKNDRVVQLTYYVVQWDGGSWTDYDGRDRDIGEFVGWIPFPTL